MRMSLVALFCASGFALYNGSGILADDKADLAKEMKKFQGAWTIESSVTGGTEVPADQLKGETCTVSPILAPLPSRSYAWRLTRHPKPSANCCC